MVNSIFDGAVSQAQYGEAWLLTANIINTNLEPELLYTGRKPRKSLTATGFSKFQSNEDVIFRLFGLRAKVPNLLMQRTVKTPRTSREVETLGSCL